MGKAFPILIWGASHHAKVVIDAILSAHEFKIFGLIDSVNLERKGSKVNGFEILGGEQVLDSAYTAGVRHAFVAVGQNSTRNLLSQRLQVHGFELPVIRHPFSVVSGSALIMPGTYIAPGSIVNADARIGPYGLINTGAIVEHDCLLAAAVHMGPGSKLGGLVEVGEETWIGVGANVRDRISIGKRAMIGAGSTVISNIPDEVVAYGVPARIIRSVKENE